MHLCKKVLIGLGLGIILGLLLQENVVFLKPFGDLFIRLIKMIIIPLIFFSIVSSMTGMQDSKALSRIGVKACIAYFLTTLSAITIGLVVGNLLQPGQGIVLHFDDQFNSLPSSQSSILQCLNILLHIVPDNAIAAMAQGTILQVVFFALFTGVALNTMDKGSCKRLNEIFQLLSHMVFKMVHLIMHLVPLAACCLTAWVIGTQGMDILKNLMKLVGCAYLAFGIQYGVFGLIIYFWTRLSPIPFFRKSLEYQTLAFSTSSSKAALPTTIKVCQKKLGVSQMSASFVLPLGASINMDGIAIYLSLCTLFFAQVTEKVLTMSDYGVIILTATLGSIGAAGIPGGTIVMLPLVLGSIGLPLEGIALIAGIDRIVDMMRTTISITGDAAVTLCVDHSEGLLDRNCYYSNHHSVDFDTLESAALLDQK